jgi:hypothetical protein
MAMEDLPPAAGAAATTLRHRPLQLLVTHQGADR